MTPDADEPYEWEGFLQRRHPHRLDPERYRIPGQTVLVTACTRERRPILLDARVRGEIIARSIRRRTRTVAGSSPGA